MHKLISLFRLYRPQGIIRASIVILRILVLPFWKIDKALPKTGIIVDIGCGAGSISNYLSLSSPERYLEGIDLSKERVQSALNTVGKRKNIKFRLGNILDLDFNTASNFLIVDVLYHLPYDQQEKLLLFLSKIIEEWLKTFAKLGFSCRISTCNPFFPASTFMAVCTKNDKI